MKKEGKDTIGIAFGKAWDKSRDVTLKQILPTDIEVNDWFEYNIDSECSASSAIYKFRLWLKQRSKL